MALSNSQYAKIMREYEEKQLNSRLIHDQRLNEIIKKVPEYKRLEDEAIDAAMEYARMTVLNASSDADQKLEALKKNISGIAERKKELLVKHGYAPNFLDPVYSCPDCRDTGYIGSEKCHCFKQAMIDLLYAQSNIKDILKTENFKNFNIDHYSKTDIDPITHLSAYDLMKGVYNTALEFVAKFSVSSDNLLFFGNAGLGKTFLSHCIADELLKRGHSVIYLSAPELFDILRKEATVRKDEDTDYSELADNIMKCDLLIIDDLGSESVTEFSVSSLNLCINERLLGKRSTLISTNLTPNEIREAYGERNFSRITGLYTGCRFYGKDIRFARV